MKTKMCSLSLIVMLALVLTGIGNTNVAGAQPLATNQNIPPFTARDTSQFTAEVPLAWFDLAYSLVRDEVLSPRTVNAHLTSIYNKLGVNSRAAATRYALEHGLA